MTQKSFSFWLRSLLSSKRPSQPRRRFPFCPSLDALEERLAPAGLPKVVADIRPQLSSSPDNLVVVGETLFFSAVESEPGRELYKSDGTAEGTGIVKDIAFGEPSSNPSRLIDVNGTLFFVAETAAFGKELWKSDGTSDGTRLVKDINPTPGAGSDPGVQTSVNVTERVNLNGLLIFTADDGQNGVELWRSDGTEAGTFIIMDINPGAAPSRPEDLTVVGDVVFFAATDPTHGRELWVTDGQAGGTFLAANIFPDEEIVVGTDPETGEEFVDIIVHSSNPTALTNFNGTLFFAARDRGNDVELWESGGLFGTQRFADINPEGNGSFPNSLTVVGDTLYFSASTFEAGEELWKTDGSTGEKVVFPDGSVFGTMLVKDIPGRSGLDGSTGLNVPMAGTTDGTLYFVANDGFHGKELWKSDGTEAGTVLVKDIREGSAPSQINQLIALGNQVYFTAVTAEAGLELWTSDGTADGTSLVKDSLPGPFSVQIRALTVFQDTLFYGGFDSNVGTELLKLDFNVDLLVKNNSLPDPFVGENIFETIPSAAQTKSLVVPQGFESRFEILVENNTDEEQPFVLKQAVPNVPAGFTVRYFEDVGNVGDPLTDITAQITGDGFLTENIQPDDFFSITVAITPDNTVLDLTEGSVVVQVFALEDLNTPLDAVKVEALAGFFVTTQEDGADDFPDDGVLDSDPDTPGQQISLRALIDLANLTAFPETISFLGILGAEVPRLTFLVPLPVLTQPVTIDGTTHPSGRVELRGPAGAGIQHGLVVQGGNSTIRGLALNRFSGDALQLISDANVIVNNFIGTDATGTTAEGNGGNGVLIAGANNRLGGTGAGEGNVIAGNVFDGVSIEGAEASNNVVTGNRIGIGVNGESLPNQGDGVLIRDSASGNTIGGLLTTAANIIAGNLGSGVGIIDNSLGNAILGNTIFGNGGLGIDLGNDGVTPNDPLDADGSPNRLQNFPTLTTAVHDGLNTRINGTLESTPNTTFRIEIFTNLEDDLSGFGEGHTLVASTTVTTDADGEASFFVLPLSAPPVGTRITATATNLTTQDTSEFSPVVLVDPSIKPEVTINQATAQADPTSDQPILFTVVFSQSVTGFVGSDISFAGSTVSGTLQAVVTEAGPLDGTTFTVAVSGATSNGDVVASVNAGAAQNVNGETSLASTSTDNTVTLQDSETPPDDVSPVVVVPDDRHPGQQKVIVTGTNEDDVIHIRQETRTRTENEGGKRPRRTRFVVLSVTIQNAQQQIVHQEDIPLAGLDLSAIFVHALGGNDSVFLRNRLPISSILFGGDGDDFLSGGDAGNVLVGGQGDDTLHAGRRADVLIGGLGADFLKGGQGPDLLISGFTDFEEDEDRLSNLLDNWSSLGRQVNLQELEVLGDVSLSAPTIQDDEAQDQIRSNRGRDLVIAQEGEFGRRRNRFARVV
jgi:ELWxxDGT repeat protein